LRFYQQWTQRMPNQALVARSTFSVGLELPGATSGPIDKAQFASWLGQLQWLYRFPKSGLELVLRGSGQLALDPLLPFERFSVGGYYSVRGYRENQLVRDNGVSLGLDVRLPLWRSAAGRTVLQAGPFVDFGRSWNHPDRRRHGAETLGSTGVAVAWSPWSWLRAEFTYGAQLADVERPNRKSLQDHGIGFRIFATIW
jgi:hemolysin activation/secretion protein